jgi:hypothetical protein
MSSRERWTVYPLLFLTLGIALKDKVTRVVNTEQITCRRLFVTDPMGNTQVVIGATPQGGVATLEGTRRGVDVSIGHFPSQVSGLLITDANGRLLRGLAMPSTARVTVPAEPEGEPSDHAPAQPALEEASPEAAGDKREDEEK